MAKSQQHKKQKIQGMLEQRTSSLSDKKTNGDYNNEHSNHHDPGLIISGSLYRFPRWLSLVVSDLPLLLYPTNKVQGINKVGTAFLCLLKLRDG